MCDKQPVDLLDSHPYGTANMKVLFDRDGKTRWVYPDASSDDATAVVRGAYEHTAGTLKVALDGMEPFAYSVETDGEAKLRAASPDGQLFSFCWMGTDEHLLDTRLEPRSLEQIAESAPVAPPTARAVPVPQPSARDADDSEPRAALEGVWEIVQVEAAQDRELPPYGFPNYKLVIDGHRLCVAAPRATEIDTSLCAGIDVDAARIRVRDRGEVTAVLGGSNLRWSRNEWGWLVLQAPNLTTGAKRIGSTARPLPSLPPKVVLLR